MKVVVFFAAFTVFAAFILPSAVPAGQARPSANQPVPEGQPSGQRPADTDSRPAVNDGPTAPSEAYDPFKIYPGIYETDRLYIKNPDATQWRSSLKPAFIKEVTCAETVKLFYLKGWWLGHLNRDGSCGATAEPLEWATGNLLNFHQQSE